MEPGADTGAVYLSTVWTGSYWTSVGREPIPACWVLSLTPSTEYPSAFGAIRGPQLRALHGTWTPQTSTLRLVAVSIEDPSYSCIYEAVLRTEEDGSFSLQGKFQEGDVVGHFVLHAEAEDPKAHISGLWIGEAAPDASLEAFAIPTNPIRWTLATLADGTVFGSGYFDDSGDIPGRPLLFYSLQGARSGDEVQLVKQYEKAADSGPVPYRGVLSYNKAKKEWSFSGEWRNDSAGSFGNFRCRLEGAAQFRAHASCCSACQSVLRDVAFEDTESVQPWRCCTKCYRSGAGGQRKLIEEQVLVADAAKGTTCIEIVEDAIRIFMTRPFIGFRSANGFQWLTYGHIGAIAKRIARGMQSRGVRPDDKIAIIGTVSPSYVAAMLGALLAGCVLVPLDIGLDEKTMARCLSLSGCTTVIADADLLARTSQAIKASALKLTLTAVINLAAILDPNSPPATAHTTADGLFTVHLEQLTQQPPSTDQQSEVIRTSRQPTDLVALLFTSGSTGEPKAASYSEQLTRPSAGVSNVLPLVKLDIQKFHPSFLLSLLSVMQVGGRRAIVDDLGRVLEIAAKVRPTHISAPPAFWLLLQREFAAHLSHLLATQGSRPRAELEAEAAKFIRLSLGNRLVLAASGGALLAASTLEFIRATLRIPLSDLYGSRETGGIACNGQVYPGVEVRLLPLDDPPLDATTVVTRGEIAVHSQRLIQGYFRDSHSSSAAFVELDGKRFYRTGDIGEMRGGRLYVLERCGAMQKLYQSEWLAPSKVEAVLEGCPWITQVLLVVPSARTHAVAVVVPSALAAAELQKFAEKERAGAMLQHIQLWAIHHRLRAHEIPKLVLLESQPWTVEAGLLTPTFKKRRNPLLARYAAACEALAAELTAESSPSSLSTTPSFSVAFAELLARCGVSLSLVRGDATLTELGIDSLACARLAALLSDAGVRAASSRSVHLYPLSHWDALYMAAKQGAVLPDHVMAEESIDWGAECRLPSSLQCQTAPLRSEGDIFVTGGTGFFGPSLLHALLTRTANCKVFVLVRAASDAEAAQRCETDMKAAGVFDNALYGRVTALAGDLAKPRFGIAEATWTSLCGRIVHVFHSGTRVDVTLPYSSLRAVNVGGTVTAIDLALSSGANFSYVSSASALPATSPTEDWLRLAPADLTAKSGYGASKAVSEMLLHEAAIKSGLSVRIFRYSAISGDERTGQWNTRDFSFLLFSAAAAVGVLPSPARAQLHWVPVRWAADATVALALQANTRGKCFHLIGEGPSIDQGAAALRAIGFTVNATTQREWSAALAKLPPQHQALPLISELRALDFAAPNSHSIPTSSTKEALKTLGVAWFSISPAMLKSCMERIKQLVT